MVWPSIFPRLLTIWAYSGSAPGSFSGATAHLRIWERATRGNRAWIDGRIAERTRKGDSVSIWSRGHGLQARSVEPLANLRGRLASEELSYSNFFNGDTLVSDPERGALRDYYNDLHTLLQHPDLPPDERPRWEQRREITIRLLFYEQRVKVAFMRRFGTAISEGAAILGKQVPPYADLNRKKSIEAIEQFSVGISGSSPPAAANARDLLTRGLKALDPALIPIDWL